MSRRIKREREEAAEDLDDLDKDLQYNKLQRFVDISDDHEHVYTSLSGFQALHGQENLSRKNLKRQNNHTEEFEEVRGNFKRNRSEETTIDLTDSPPNNIAEREIEIEHVPSFLVSKADVNANMDMTSQLASLQVNSRHAREYRRRQLEEDTDTNTDTNTNTANIMNNDNDIDTAGMLNANANGNNDGDDSQTFSQENNLITGLQSLYTYTNTNASITTTTERKRETEIEVDLDVECSENRNNEVDLTSALRAMNQNSKHAMNYQQRILQESQQSQAMTTSSPTGHVSVSTRGNGNDNGDGSSSSSSRSTMQSLDFTDALRSLHRNGKHAKDYQRRLHQEKHDKEKEKDNESMIMSP
jgi:hypothetical protein